MSGASQLNLLTKMLKFTSQGIRIAVSNILRSHLASKNVNLNIKQSIADGNLSRFTNENTPEQKGAVGKNVQNAPKKRTDFDKTKFLNEENKDCTFVNEDLLTYISVIGDKKRIMKHKKTGNHSCQLPTCGAPFIMGQTMIGPVRIASPNTAPGYGSVLWVCRKHVVASIDGRDHVNIVRNLFDVAPEDNVEDFDSEFDISFEQDTTANAEGIVGDGQALMSVGEAIDVDVHQESVNDIQEGDGESIGENIDVVDNEGNIDVEGFEGNNDIEGVDRDIDVEQGHVELRADQEVFEESVDEMRTNTLQDFSSPRDGGHEDGLESDAIEGMEECVNTSSSSTEM